MDNQSEITMRRFAQIAGSLFLCFAQFAFASSPAPRAPTNASLSGHYYFEGGSELGSELLLRDNGKYEWMMIYGADDMSSSGTWLVKDNEVVLTAAHSTPVFRLFEEDELRIRKPVADGKWVAIVGVPNMGPVADVEVKFEAKSGKTADAKSIQNGDAIVMMPAGEQWARAALRGPGGQGEWQWIDVPAVRAKARIAGFAISNPESVQQKAFSTLRLKPERGGLVAQKGILAQGVYTKK